MGGDEGAVPPAGAAPVTGSMPASGRRPYWRSQSWSASRTAVDRDGSADASTDREVPPQGRRPPPPLTPRSQQNCKARSCLPPLQPLSIARRSMEEWPMAGSDDVGEWPQPVTPGTRPPPVKLGEGMKVDISAVRCEGKRSQIAFFDKECSKVAEHIYLGGDAVARNREILRQNGITHVLNCVGFVCPEYFKSDLVYKTLWLQDSPSEDITSILYDVFDYFEDVREHGGRVFVHCCQGVSRSTSLVIAYLMWREGQSFEDAFDFVKAARGIANPNMGFACQLLQCQKRVHAIPLSPNSVLRMFRMAPHSPYDALHLVPKMLSDPSPSALDSRGAFILHVLSSIYVWVGKKCELAMERDAKAAAFQVVRYEKVPGPIVVVQEGEEPPEFWEAFSRVPLQSDPTLKINKDQIGLSASIAVGKRKVDAYSADFELFYKGLYGGVFPPFSSSGSGQETHIPARESNWSVLRRKFVSGGGKEWVSPCKSTISRVYSDSLLARDRDVHEDRVQRLSSDSVLSPASPSPSSLSSDSSNGSKSGSASPSRSPSLNPRVTPFIPPSLCAPLSSSGNPGSLPTAGKSTKVDCSPKRSGRSLAERRGSFSPSLKLSAMKNDCSNPSQVGLTSIPIPRGHDSLPQDISGNDPKLLSNSNIPCYPSNIDIVTDNTSVKNSVEDSWQECGDLSKSTNLWGSSVFCPSFVAATAKDLQNSVSPLAYRWPDLKKIASLSHNDLDSKIPFLVLFPKVECCSPKGRRLYVWTGSCCPEPSSNNETNDIHDAGEKSFDWNKVCYTFLDSFCLPKEEILIKVVREEEWDEFLKLLQSFSTKCEG